MEDRKVAVVTGASRGLGAAFARVLAEEGYAVALGARDREGIERLASELPAPSLACPLDVADAAGVAAFRDAVLGRFGRVDALVNNAGIGIFKRLEDFSAEEFARTFQVNVQGVWAVTTAFLPRLRDSNGLVVMVSSDVSTRTFPNGGAYTASKFALRALARTFQQENPGLRVLELRPGAVDTHFAGSTPGAPGKEWFLRPETVAETLRFALRLPPEARLEEIVVRGRSQPPEY
ncbi:MAG: SDR family oxidoreductase [Thermoanaerobaculia bacterium]